MSKRLEAATIAFHGAMDEPVSEPSDWIPEMTAALKASDDALFSDEAVGRVGAKVADFFNYAYPLRSIVGDPRWTRPELRLAIRRVLQALKESADV